MKQVCKLKGRQFPCFMSPRVKENDWINDRRQLEVPTHRLVSSFQGVKANDWKTPGATFFSSRSQYSRKCTLNWSWPQNVFASFCLGSALLGVLKLFTSLVAEDTGGSDNKLGQWHTLTNFIPISVINRLETRKNLKVVYVREKSFCLSF